METTKKVVYESPETKVYEIKPEGVICTSGRQTNYEPVEW